MEYLVTGRQAKAIDTYTIEQTGIPSLVLMERASLCVAEEVQKTADQMHLPVVRIAVVCGSGNNGGDGIATARILHERGLDVCIFLAGKREKMSADCQKQLAIAEKLSVPISNGTDLSAYNIIIDAIFGIGLDRLKAITETGSQPSTMRHHAAAALLLLIFLLVSILTAVMSWVLLSVPARLSLSVTSKQVWSFIPEPITPDR